MKPIATFSTHAKYPYDVPRQGSLNISDEVGVIEFEAGHDFEQALEDLEGFERIWVIYEFHHNSHWKPKTRPPRGPHVKRGVFSTRSPYRPNPIGLSCVRLLKVEARKVFVQEFDLLDGTPIFDVKPYIPYADSFPMAKTGWLETLEQKTFVVELSEGASRQLKFLESFNFMQLRTFLVSQLAVDPIDSTRKRVRHLQNDQYEISYRTWRAVFELSTDSVCVTQIFSGYSPKELMDVADPHNDKDTHRTFIDQFKTN